MVMEIGKKAPAFTLPDANGKKVSLKDFLGNWVVLYFYPKDDTPGCTKEACAFRDLHGQLTMAGAVVIGVSADPSVSHAKFSKKYDLPFLLLSDTDRKVAEKYGVYREKTMYGKTSMGIVRSTFIIDPRGRFKKFSIR